MAEPLLHTHTDDPTDRLSALLDNALAGVEQEQAQHLVDACPACRIELAELRTMQSWLRDLPSITPPRSFTLDPAQYHAHSGNRWFGLLRWGGALAILLLFVGIGVAALQSNRSTTSTALRLPDNGAETGSSGAASDATTVSQPMAAAAVASSASPAESSGGGAAATMAAAAPAQQTAAAGGATLSTAATSTATAASGAAASNARPPLPEQAGVAATAMAATTALQTSVPAADSAQRTMSLAITPTSEQLPTAPPLTRMTETPVFSAKEPIPAAPVSKLGRGWIYGGILGLLVLAALAVVMNRRRS